MKNEFSFFIHGHPAPGGSKTFFPVWRGKPVRFPGDLAWELVTTVRNGRPWPIIRVVDDAGQNNKDWKAACSVQARAFMRQATFFNEAMHVHFVFFLRRPKAHYRTGKFAHMLRDDAPREHIQAPDALKFARSTEDALTGVVWRDDATNVKVTTEKRWMKHDEHEGCAVSIKLLRSGAEEELTLFPQ